MKYKIAVLVIFFWALGFCVDIYAGQEEKIDAVMKGLSFDKKTGGVSYELVLPAWVRLRVGVADGPLYRSIADWEQRPAGKHKEKWDGLDASGIFKLGGQDNLVVTFAYFTAGDEYLRNIQVTDILPLAGDFVGRHLPNLEVNRMHKKHERKFCREPKIRVSFLKKLSRNKDNLYIVKEKTPIKIEVAEADRAWFEAERYSIHVFIDNIFTRGELDGYSPYTWTFDPKGLNEGKHLIVINLAGFNDHYGIASLPVYVKR